MDRIDELAIFVAVADHGSFVAAARRLRRSPAAVTRAVAALEDRLATRLFNRTTRAVALTDAGSRYLDQCRRALAEFEEIELSAASERLEPRGLLTVTAPEMFGRMHVLPIAQEFMQAYPAVRVSMLLLDRLVSFVDEGIDVGVRIAQLADSSMRAIHVGHVRRVLCASPAYLAAHGVPRAPRDLANHDTIITAGSSVPADQWSFASDGKAATTSITSRLVVNTVLAGLEAAMRGGGIARALSYQVEPFQAEGKLKTILADHEPPPIPIHIVHPAGRYLAPKVRLFIDAAVERLRRKFAGSTPARRTLR
ncbi:MAG TPA: LysR family transcriptional regulator [Alphaproteobacteria bacterium]